MGRSFIIDNKYRDAIETLNILLRFDPKAYEGYFLRGVAKYNLNDLHGAEYDFSLAIDNNPVYTMAYHYRAITRSRMGNYDDALNDFREAIDLRPDLPGPYYSRGVTFLMNRQFDKAIDDFDEFLKFDPKVSEVYSYKGTCYIYLKDTVSAFECFDQAIRTNRYSPDGYNRRGVLHMIQNHYEEALADFDKAIQNDSDYVMSYFNRALLFSNNQRPLDAIDDFNKVLELDSTSSVTYFNRAILRTQIGDYNNALEDYNNVALLNPNNVLVYYNRAALLYQLGYLEDAIEDYTRSIELYPDFANAYLGRSSLRYMLRDFTGAKSDQEFAELKIAEYRSKLNDSTFSIYADTSRHFNRLISFDYDFSNEFETALRSNNADITLLPQFKFIINYADGQDLDKKYYSEKINDFIEEMGLPGLVLTNRESDMDIDSLLAGDSDMLRELSSAQDDWKISFSKGITQYLIKQYTNSINSYNQAIEQEPANPYLYINRSATRSEMIDFISSIESNFKNITLDTDPVNRLHINKTIVYSYDEALSDLNKAIKLMPDLAYAYYNRGNLQCLSGKMPEAIEDYTKAIELFPDFAEAYYNRGLVQIYLKDSKKGFLDINKAGELGIDHAYDIMREYGSLR
ncbi:MAG: tetratricopeptide repeat protein [Rikenellaceae bacterium]|nr:tetratricopeptide repeat protein [Rikenellaceae bacterium]